MSMFIFRTTRTTRTTLAPLLLLACRQDAAQDIYESLK